MIEMPFNPMEKSTNLLPDGTNRMAGFTDFCIREGFKTVLELGRDVGWGSTYFILKSGVELWSVDNSDENYLKNHAEVLDSIPTYHKILADDTMPIPEIDGKIFDMVFLDTSHEYEHTKYELRRYFPQAAKWFLVDDYHWSTETPALTEFSNAWQQMPFGNDIFGIRK